MDGRRRGAWSGPRGDLICLSSQPAENDGEGERRPPGTGRHWGVWTWCEYGPETVLAP